MVALSATWSIWNCLLNRPSEILKFIGIVLYALVNGDFQCLILWLLLLDKIIILDNAVYIKDIYNLKGSIAKIKLIKTCILVLLI